MSYRFYRNITSAFIFSSLIFSQNMPSWIVDMPKDISYYWAREVRKKGLAEDDYKEKGQSCIKRYQCKLMQESLVVQNRT